MFFFKALQCVPIFQENEDIQDCGTSCHYDLGKNNRHKTERGDGTEEKSIGEEQFRFMLGRGTTDAIFAARRVIEKHREMLLTL